MRNCLKFYIDGRWVDPTGSRKFDVIDPTTEQRTGQVSMGEKEDVDRAVAAARKAFEGYSHSSLGERVDLLQPVWPSA